MSKYIGDVSAYAYAVSKGYTGTEEEFAELMADYANVGQRAEDAADRAKAALDEFTSVTAEATTLPEGSSASASYDSGVLTFGIPKGDTGATGAVGPQGPKGDTGSTGPQGPKGDKGDTGAQGIKGDKGDTGAQGIQGEQGEKGEKGDKGDKGDTGEVTQAEFDELSGDVSDLKEDFTALQDTPIIKDNFRIGNIDITSDGWTYSPRATRVTTAIGLSIYLKKGDVIGLSDYTGKRFYIGWKRANGTYGVKGWNTSDVAVTEDGFYVINMAKVPETAISDVAELTDYLFIKSAAGLASSAAYANCLPNTALNDHFHTLLLGHGKYVDYDSVNGTITIPADTIYIGYVGDEIFAHVINNATQIVIQNVTVSTVGSSACKLLLNTKTWEFELKPWSFGYYNVRDPYKYLLIANIRLKTGSFPGSISSPTPWSIDGKPYGISLAGYNRDFIVKSVNHRGWNTAPENTLVAFKESAKHAYKYAECDVQFTSDGVAVLLHDGTINRTARDSSGNELSSTVNIADITYETALTYDFGIYKGSVYAGTKIPSFTDFLKLCKNLSLHPYIELKTGTQAQIESLVSAVKQNGMKGNVTWISFSTGLLSYVVGADSKARVGLLVSAVTSESIAQAQNLRTSDNEVFIDSAGYTTAEVELCVNADMPLEVWTINAESTAIALPSYVTGVTTDSINVGDILLTNAIA